MWRRALFAKHFPQYGNDFMSADIDEKAIRAPSPEEMTVLIAKGKADALLPKLAGREVLLVCLDQVVVCNGQVREKPENEEQARAFLESYRSGHGASCVNGMVVHNTATGRRVTAEDTATVFWKHFPDSVVDSLVRKGDILSSAGGFVVEDPELSTYVDRIEGDIDAIEGLPVRALGELLRRAQMPAVTHVLFDMDGLLLDTENAYTVVQQEIVQRWGKNCTWDLKVRMMGKKALEACQLLIDELDLSKETTAEEFLAEREKGLDLHFAKAELMPGVDRLVRHLHRHKIPIAVATSSHTRHFELKTSLHRELFALMDHIVTGDQVQKSKPDPEIFFKAASLFKGETPDPTKVLVFEDAPLGVDAGLAAGMQVCHVPAPQLERHQRGLSHCELKSLQDFKPEEWGLPPFEAA